MHVDTQQATPALAATQHDLPLARASIVVGLLLFIAGMVFDLVVYPGIAADAGSALPIYSLSARKPLGLSQGMNGVLTCRFLA